MVDSNKISKKGDSISAGGKNVAASISEKLQIRYDAITHQLAGHRVVPVTTADIWCQLEGVTHSGLRTLQRDLTELERRGLIVRKDTGWVIGDTFDDEIFDSFAAAVALDVMLKSLDWAIPAETLEQLAKPLLRVKNRLRSAFDDHPRLRWLNALTILKPYHPLDRPEIDPEVRDAVEKSIQDRTKVRLTYQHRGEQFTKTVSISDYLIRLPDEPKIRVWPDDAERPLVIGLESIESAESSTDRAEWPKKKQPDEVPESELSLIEVRASPQLIEFWKNKWINRTLEVLSVDEAGWTTCCFLARTSPDVIRYLVGFGSQVEVRKPYSLRMFVENEVRTATKMYDASREDSIQWCQDEIQSALATSKSKSE